MYHFYSVTDYKVFWRETGRKYRQAEEQTELEIDIKIRWSMGMSACA